MRLKNVPDRPILRSGLTISRGLVGAWLMNDCGGSSVREHVYRNRLGTLNGPTWVSSELGTVLSFTNNTYVDTNEPARYQFAGGKFTTIMRIKPGTIATHHGFLGCLDWGADKGWFFRSDGAVNYAVVIGNSIYGLASGTTLNSNVWTDLALTWVSGGPVSSYCNGSYVASVNVKAFGDSGRNLYIGKEQGPAYGYVGLWSAVLIYNRVLTPNEIAALHRDIYLPFRAPSGIELMAGSAGTTTVRLTWTDNSEGEDGFSIERDEDGGGFAAVHVTAAGVETWDDELLPTGHTYTYRVQATSAALGDSEYSNEAEVTV